MFLIHTMGFILYITDTTNLCGFSGWSLATKKGLVHWIYHHRLVVKSSFYHLFAWVGGSTHSYYHTAILQIGFAILYSTGLPYYVHIIGGVVWCGWSATLLPTADIDCEHPETNSRACASRMLWFVYGQAARRWKSHMHGLPSHAKAALSSCFNRFMFWT